MLAMMPYVQCAPAGASDADVGGGGARPPVPPVLSGKRAIIVEGEGVTVLQLRRVLQRAGLRVDAVAHTGQEGIDLIRDLQPDIVLLDADLNGADGLDVARQVLAMLPASRPCVVLLSDSAVVDTRREARELGVCGYIKKPVVGENLLRELEEAYIRFVGDEVR